MMTETEVRTWIEALLKELYPLREAVWSGNKTEKPRLDRLETQYAVLLSVLHGR